MSARGAVLVTGAGRRVGAAIAERIAQDGWTILLHYRSSDAEAQAIAESIKAKGGRAELFKADLANAEALQSMCDALGARGDWTGLVNSAASFEPDHLADFEIAAALRQMQLNLAAPIYLMRRLKEARAGEPGFVINISDQKVLNPNPDYLSYTLSKIGLAHATGVLAQAGAPNLRVNCIAAGLMLPSGPQSEEQFARVHGRTLTGQGATPTQVADAVAYFASAENVTGALLSVDGGQHLVGSLRDVMFL